jgi:hypothetical protein
LHSGNVGVPQGLTRGLKATRGGGLCLTGGNVGIWES